MLSIFAGLTEVNFEEIHKNIGSVHCGDWVHGLIEADRRFWDAGSSEIQILFETQPQVSLNSVENRHRIA